MNSTNLAFIRTIIRPLYKSGIYGNTGKQKVIVEKKILLKKVHKISHLQFATRRLGVTANIWKMVLCYDKKKIEYLGAT